MAGYDRRDRFTQSVSSRTWRPQFGILSTARGSLQKQSTVSFRSNPTGKTILPSDIDPYAHFLAGVTERKQRTISETLASGKSVPGRVIPDKRSPIIDTGHPFWTTKTTVGTSARGLNYFFYTGRDAFAYGGPAIAVYATVAPGEDAKMPFYFGVSSSSSTVKRQFLPEYIPVPAQSNLNEYGARAINTLAPASPPIDTFAMVGELLTGFPRIVGSALFKGAGSASGALSGEFLNIIFGVLPTLSDVQKLIRQLSKITAAVQQLQRDQGNGVRRRLDFPVERTSVLFQGTQLESQGQIQIGTNPGFNIRGGTGAGLIPVASSVKSQLAMQKKRTISFSGSFSYAIPLPKGFSERTATYLALGDRALGLTPNLSASWQLTPWSWLLDWIYDIGSVLDLYRKVQDDNLVINYGYLMCTTEHRATQHTELALFDGYPSSITYADTWAVSLRKERIRANPFGFIPLESPELNPMRLAILAALGLSRR